MKEKECGAKLQLIENTCCMILPEELRKMDSGQFANRRLMQKLERLLHNLIKKFGMYHIAVNLPPDSSHDIIRLMNKTLEKYQDISLYLVGESEIQGIRYGQDRKNIEKELFPFFDPPVGLKSLPPCEKRMVDRSDHILMVLPGEEEEIEGELRDILEYAKRQNKNIIKINEKTLQVKAYSKQE
ncbi:hypothetical protein [Acetivibrio sp. MSJd-27]|jgi:hypothetical protein|uniref:hypothetical protein n=1 Tax=Acetivibrio sp. MSJd-27 TaxID=2841523 RepID=UPI0015AB762C|nr:hypothetical protein [Acetivibrio sp. MSJd-27]MBU5450535.1 hypothetical protein [Acetivibrio sp. MSJd-27]